MTHKKTYFYVGIFVILGIVLSVAALIWIGASKYFEKGSRYVTYFDESVQGLQTDSVVKYRGVDIGRVERIRVAPDQRLVEVLMKVNVARLSVDELVAKLSLAGITGIVFVDLDRKRPSDVVQSPVLTFKPPYPVIQSNPSDIKKIQASINDILDSFKALDLKGVLNDLSNTIRSIDSLANSEKVNRIIADISEASNRMASVTRKADAIAASGTLEKTMEGARNTLEEARATIVKIRGEVENMRLGSVAREINRTVDGTSKKVRSAAGEVERAAETLRRTSDSLESLVNRLNLDPSALIFSSPPVKDKGE
jgi:phospholipid/cholesterol/gamma-HCH transport system substrate-binding protein